MALAANARRGLVRRQHPLSPGQADDFSFVALSGEANYQQYDSPYPGETVGAFDGAVTVFPGETNKNAAVTYASGLRGTYDILKAQWLHTSAHATSRLQVYQTQFGSTAGGPFWDDLSYPDGVISLATTQGGRETGTSFDVDQFASYRHHLLYGLEYRVNNSFLYQVVPTPMSSSTPTDAVHRSRLRRRHLEHRTALEPGRDRALRPHAYRAQRRNAVRRCGDRSARIVRVPHRSGVRLRVAFDHTTVAPKPLEADRTIAQIRRRSCRSPRRRKQYELCL